MITHKTLNTLANTFLFLLFFSFSLSSFAQPIWQIDSRIERMTVEKSGEYYILNINVKANNDDDARSAKLIVNLPRNCKVNGITMPAGFENTAHQVFSNKTQASPKSGNGKQIDSYINFDLPNLGTRTDLTFKVSFVPTADGLRRGSEASAFIYSLTPEKDKKNNLAVVAIN